MLRFMRITETMGNFACGPLLSKPKAPPPPSIIVPPPLEAPKPEPVTPMPDAGSVTGQAKSRRDASAKAASSGRLSTILDGGDTLG